MMPKEPRTLVDVLAGLPNGADYDVAYASLMATDAGRRFLAELTRRNRNADTQMVLGAVARVEAAIRGDAAPQIPAIVTRELTEVAAALDRATAAVAAARVPAEAILAAVERIQDIAFVLHERPVELTLCDALDAAVRDIADAVAGADADGERQGLRRVTELLRALTRRVNAMIALALETDATDLPSTGGAQAASAAGTTPSEPVDDDATLAAAVAMLAASMPAPSDAVLPSQDFFEHREAAPGTPAEQVTVAALSQSDSSAEPANTSEAARNESEGADDGAPLRALEALSEEELLALFS
jgi:hypothetical protein